MLFINKSLLVQINSFINNLISFFPTLKPINKNLLIFQFFIIFEKSMYLLDNMLWKLLNIIVMINRLIIISNSNNLIIKLTLINHSHHPNNFRINKRQYFKLHTTYNKYIEGIMIITVGHWDETIISGVMNCAEENAI